jgi:23S rRNA (adenine2503-C2)-methyltransferase
MQDIKELGLKELESFLKRRDKPVFHAQQIFSWIYKKGIDEFDKMTDLPSDLRNLLKNNFYILGIKLEKKIKSQDGTEKFLFKLKDNNFIESVIIPTEKRNTACISTQVGCKFKCAFCASGARGFIRDLSCSEILEEILYLKNSSQHRLTHIVFMGIGEPLDNYENLIKAIKVINSPESFNIGARRITVSTCGIIPKMEKLSKQGLQIELSISLHAADDLTRSLLVPINKRYPIKQLIQACHTYVRNTNRQITFEYILIKGINSDLQKAKDLVKILRGLNCKVNVIAYNPIKGFDFQPPAKLEALYFMNYLKKSGINVTLRHPRGVDIEAGCGQLRLRMANR